MSDTYTLEMRDGQANESIEFDYRPSEAEINEACDDWVSEGEWGPEGASIDVWWKLSLDGEKIDSGAHTTEVGPDHEHLIRLACVAKCRSKEGFCGDSPEAHEWTSEGEGGLKENPGVFSLGGTTMLFETHCRKCGLQRKEYHTGSQRNPGEHDVFQYRLPPTWCVECQSETCHCEKE